MPSVSEDGIIDTSITRSFSEVKVGYTFFEENDVIFTKITPCMENGKGGIATGLMNRVGFGSTEFHVLRPINGKSNSYWLYYLTMLPEFRKEAADNMTGASGHRRVPEKFMKNYKVFLPPIECQNEFADYVKSIDKLKFIPIYLDIEVSEENNGLY